jgi:hypothetical protein
MVYGEGGANTVRKFMVKQGLTKLLMTLSKIKNCKTPIDTGINGGFKLRLQRIKFLVLYLNGGKQS